MNGDCGCQARRERLNRWRPGLGDQVARVAEPIKEAGHRMGKGAAFVLGVIAGYFAIPWALRYYAERVA